jgi:hypothetical protein
MSKIKVNTVAPRSGTTVTLGEAGDTIALGACASQTGFGRTGTVDWCTTAKTGPLTAVSGKGYMINTCGGAVTVTLPASPSAGDIVSLKDYKDTWGTACKAVTLGRNSSKISGSCIDASLNTSGQSVTMVYIDGTQGWLNIQTDTTVKGTAYICASGGNATVTCGDYKTHIFTADGTLTVNSTGNPSANAIADYAVIAGGGGGGFGDGGGGGAGGFRIWSTAPGCNSPHNNSPSGTSITVAASPYSISVGAAGVGGANPNGVATVGGDSTFGPITSAGGGRGSGYSPSPASTLPGDPGGSGSGGSGSAAVGNGNDPPVSPPQGNNGGTGAPGSAGGGGGAGAVGGNAVPAAGGNGGAGSYIANPFMSPTAPSYGTPGPVGSTRYFSGGAGGYGDSNKGSSSDGGGGEGGRSSPPSTGTAGTTNTGGGGGPGTPTTAGANGGSGIVMIRYKYQ